MKIGNLSLPSNAQRKLLQQDGVLCLREALDKDALALAADAYHWSLAHPGPFSSEVLAGVPGSFYQDHANPNAFNAYKPLLVSAGLGKLIAWLLCSQQLWLLYEQIWLKKGESSATPWHQDLPYIPLAGKQLATVWINLDPVESSQSLNFVRGSHLGPLYNPTAFKAEEPEATMFVSDAWPTLPDIQNHLEEFDLLAWDLTPGDLIVFHPAILHGGGATLLGKTRRTLSLRFFGDDAYCDSRPLAPIPNLNSNDPMVAMFHLPPGSPFRHPAFPRLV